MEGYLGDGNIRIVLHKVESLADIIQFVGIVAHIVQDIPLVHLEVQTGRTIKYVNENDIPQKEAALEIINSNMQPDAKEKALLKKAPQAYRYLLQNVWPSLRRTDYTIEYDVQAFNVAKAREVIKTRPQKLSLQEMYLVAQTYPKGSAEFNNVFDIAVRMFPEDKLANLNAASAAIERGDKVSAEKYLLKAGDSAEANNARGCLASMKEDYQTAKQYFEKAIAGGLKEAQENLDKVNQAL